MPPAGLLPRLSWQGRACGCQRVTGETCHRNLPMTEAEARRQLRRMLRSFTAGSVLHLLADLCRASAQRAGNTRHTVKARQLQAVQSTLFVVGLGIDAACPR